MIEEDYRKIYGRCRKSWGEESEIRMCIEEMSELTKELCKYMRLCHSTQTDEIKLKIEKQKSNIAEETADVFNTVEQIQIMFGEDEVNEVRKQKMARLKKELDNYEKK